MTSTYIFFLTRGVMWNCPMNDNIIGIFKNKKKIILYSFVLKFSNFNYWENVKKNCKILQLNTVGKCLIFSSTIPETFINGKS